MTVIVSRIIALTWLYVLGLDAYCKTHLKYLNNVTAMEKLQLEINSHKTTVKEGNKLINLVFRNNLRDHIIQVFSSLLFYMTTAVKYKILKTIVKV